MAVVRYNVEFPCDLKHWSELLFGKLPIPNAAALAAIRDAGPNFFEVAFEVFGAIRDFQQAAYELGQKTNREGSALLLPLRAALTSETNGPELGPMLSLVRPDEIAARLVTARRLAQ